MNKQNRILTSTTTILGVAIDASIEIAFLTFLISWTVKSLPSITGHPLQECTPVTVR